ncbi:MAG: epimerase [Phycisphaerae bacterium]|jgi:UDP-glucose 4-epimerase|nr:MAG: epimerase [Phycisphaerae bacterium]
MDQMTHTTDWRSLHGHALENKPVLVTGGAGFIGSHLVEALIRLGADVKVLDDLSAGNPSNLVRGATLVRGSILDPAIVESAIQDREIVFHLAALVSVPQSVLNPRAYHEVNGTGTLNILEACRKLGTRRVIYSASSSAYGDAPELPKIETMPDRPKSPYAAAKLIGECYVSAYASCYNLDTISLRYFNIFGPRQNPHSPYSGVIAAFSKMILSGQPPRITGDGSASRDFTFVHNAVHANLLAARASGRLNGDVVNVGVGKRYTVLQLAEAMLGHFGRTDLRPEFAPPRPGDVPHSLADLTKARRVLGYEPIVDFETGLKLTCEWYGQSLAPLIQ